jgi:hypothetical protein
LKLIYARIAKPSSETTQNREKEFSHYSSRKEGIEKHDEKEARWNLSVTGVIISFFVPSTNDRDEDFSVRVCLARGFLYAFLFGGFWVWG